MRPFYLICVLFSLVEFANYFPSAVGFNIVSPLSLSVHVKPILLNLKLGADLNPFLIYSFLTILPLLGVLHNRRNDDFLEVSQECRLARACVLGAQISYHDKYVDHVLKNSQIHLVKKEVLEKLLFQYENELRTFTSGFHTSKEMCRVMYRREFQHCS